MYDKQPSFVTSLISGGVAGFAVDICLFPLDTIKTRLQSPHGFLKAGGFKGIYKGLSITAIGSAPGAALFFSTYDTSKRILSTSTTSIRPEFIHMIAASFGEIVACSVRVPIENIKQRMQVGATHGILNTITSITNAHNGLQGLYRGFGITIMREIPFALIQFPIYEKLKITLCKGLNRPVSSYEAALCGSFSGAIAAALTTPLDVIKTRLMLGTDAAGVPYKHAWDTLTRLYAEGKTRPGGPKSVFFAGIQPRVMWISIGGFFFFGAYEQSKKFIEKVFPA